MRHIRIHEKRKFNTKSIYPIHMEKSIDARPRGAISGQLMQIKQAYGHNGHVMRVESGGDSAEAAPTDGAWMAALSGRKSHHYSN